MGQKLFIGGLSFNTSTDRLRELFAQVEGVASVSIVNDRDTGHSRGFGFVEMETSEAAAEAVRRFNGVQLAGTKPKRTSFHPNGRGQDEYARVVGLAIKASA